MMSAVSKTRDSRKLFRESKAGVCRVFGRNLSQSGVVGPLTAAMRRCAPMRSLLYTCSFSQLASARNFDEAALICNHQIYCIICEIESVDYNGIFHCHFGKIFVRNFSSYGTTTD